MEIEKALVAWECDYFVCRHKDENSEFCNEKSKNYPAGLCKRCKYGIKCENCMRLDNCERGKSLSAKQDKWNEKKFDPDEMHKITDKKCKTCKYRAATNGAGVCDYNLKKFKMRNAPVGYCNTWEPKERKKAGRPKKEKTPQTKESDRKVEELKKAIAKRKEEEEVRMAKQEEKTKVAPVQQKEISETVRKIIIQAMIDKQESIEAMSKELGELNDYIRGED